MDKKISPYVVFVLIHISLIFFEYPERIFECIDRGHWQPILIGCMLELTVIWIYLNGLVSFPNMDLVDIFKRMAGSWFSRAALLPLVFYCFASIVLHARSHAEILTIILTPNTPIWVLMLLFLSISLFAAWSGIHVVLRTGFLVAVIFIPIIILTLISAFKNIDVNNAMPLWNNDPGFFVKPSFYSGFFAFSGFLYIGMIRPYIKLESSNKRTFMLVYLVGIIPLFLASIYIPLLIFGQETVSRYLFPVIAAMDTVDLYWLIFDRVTMFYVTASLTLMIVSSAVFMWMAAQLIHKLYAPFPQKWLSACLTIVCFVASILIPGLFSIDRLIWLDTGIRFYCIVGIPCMVALMSLAHRRRSVTQ